MSTLNEARKELAPSFFAATIPGPSRKNWRFELKSAGIESNPSFPFKASSRDGQKRSQRGFFSESFRLNLQLDFFSLSLEIKFVWRLKPKSDWWP